MGDNAPVGGGDGCGPQVGSGASPPSSDRWSQAVISTYPFKQRMNGADMDKNVLPPPDTIRRARRADAAATSAAAPAAAEASAAAVVDVWSFWVKLWSVDLGDNSLLARVDVCMHIRPRAVLRLARALAGPPPDTGRGLLPVARYVREATRSPGARQAPAARRVDVIVEVLSGCLRPARTVALKGAGAWGPDLWSFGDGAPLLPCVSLRRGRRARVARVARAATGAGEAR